MLFTDFVYCVSTSDKKVLKGNINIAGGSIKDIPSGEKPFMFEVHCSLTNGGGDVLVLNAPSAADKAAWIKCLQLYASVSGLSGDSAVLALKQKLTEFNQDHIFNFVPKLSADSHLFEQVSQFLLFHLKMCSWL